MKNKFILPILAAFFIAAAIFSSCEKEEDAVAPTPIAQTGQAPDAAFLSQFAAGPSRQDLCHSHQKTCRNATGTTYSIYTCCSAHGVGGGTAMNILPAFNCFNDLMFGNSSDTVRYSPGWGWSVKAYDSNGGVVATITINEDSHFDVDNVPSGTYELRLLDADGTILDHETRTFPLADTAPPIQLRAQ